MAAYRVPQVTSGLQIFWRLDANANDTSGNSNNGSVVSGGSASPTLSFSTADNPPQPELPPYDYASSGGGSTSGTATLTAAASAASTGATSTSGTAAVSKSNVVATASATTSAIADIFKPGGQGWRPDPQSVISVASFGRTHTTSTSFSACTWVRRYRASSSFNTLLTAFFNGVDPNINVYLGVAGSTARILVNTNAAITVLTLNPAATLGDWVHLAITYDGAQTSARMSTDLWSTRPRTHGRSALQAA